MHRSQRETAGTSAVAMGPKPAHGKRVMIVDDDSAILKGVRVRLRAEGYETSEARDGDECLARTAQERPDVIVLDQRMPRLDGLSTLARLRGKEQTRHIPVIMLSASVADRHAALEAGARLFVAKPYDRTTLLSAIRDVIE